MENGCDADGKKRDSGRAGEVEGGDGVAGESRPAVSRARCMMGPSRGAWLPHLSLDTFRRRLAEASAGMGCMALQRTAAYRQGQMHARRREVWADVWQDGCEDDATDLWVDALNCCVFRWATLPSITTTRKMQTAPHPCFNDKQHPINPISISLSSFFFLLSPFLAHPRLAFLPASRSLTIHHDHIHDRICPLLDTYCLLPVPETHNKNSNPPHVARSRPNCPPWPSQCFANPNPTSAKG